MREVQGGKERRREERQFEATSLSAEGEMEAELVDGGLGKMLESDNGAPKIAKNKKGRGGRTISAGER